MTPVTPEDLVAHYGLRPLPREGGLFRQTWAGPDRPDGRPEGTAIVVLLTAGDHSALHRLPTDEVWHFYLGDPLELLLLAPDGSARIAVLGPDVLAGQQPQLTVPARTWMGGRVAPGGRVDVLRLHDGPRLHLRGLRARRRGGPHGTLSGCGHPHRGPVPALIPQPPHLRERP